MMPTKAKLRVMLKRLSAVAKASGCSEAHHDADDDERDRHPERLAAETAAAKSVCSLMPVTSSMRDAALAAVASVCIARRPQAARIAPVMRPVTSSGELVGDRLVGDLAAAPHARRRGRRRRTRRACGG